MNMLLRIALAALLLATVFVTLYRIRRFRFLDDRLRYICNLSGRTAAERDETAVSRGRVFTLLARFGFSFESSAGYVYLALLPLFVALTIALVGSSSCSPPRYSAKGSSIDSIAKPKRNSHSRPE